MCVDNPDPKSARPGQLAFALPKQRPDYRRENYIVGASNGPALKLADAWVKSDSAGLIICGPAGSGKTHLGTILGEDLAADWAEVAADGGLDQVAGRDVLMVDGLERMTRPKLLLEVVERARTTAGSRLVLIGRGRPRDWASGLTDLITRLEAMSRIDLAEPDEELLRAVIAKQFRDRQIRVDPAVAEYAAPRIARTFAAAAAFVAAADEAAIETKGPVTRALARKIVNNLTVEPSRS